MTETRRTLWQRLRRTRLGLGHALVLALLLHLLFVTSSDFLARLRREVDLSRARAAGALAPTIAAIVPPVKTIEPIPFTIVQDEEAPPEPPPPDTVYFSDRDRRASAPKMDLPPAPAKNPQPRSLGNTTDMVQRLSDRPAPPPSEGGGPAGFGRPGGASEDEGGPPAPPTEPEGDTPVSAGPGGAGGRGGRGRGILKDLQDLEGGRRPMGPIFDNPNGTLYDGEGISFETKGVDWGPYAEKIYWIVRRNWIIPQAAQVGNKGVTKLRFVILKDGKIKDLQVITPAGIESFDIAALSAIQNSDPLPPPPFPEDFPEDEVGVRWSFYYNVRPEGR